MNINKLRERIDTTDDKLFDLLAERFELTDLVGELKKESDTDVLDTGREAAILKRLKTKAQKENLSPELIETIWTAIMETSKTLQAKK